jgi:hypothetical protein
MKKYLFLFLIPFAMGMTACSDDDDIASVEGRWKGTRVKADIIVLGAVAYPIDETDFDAVVEFKKDNVLTIEDDGKTVTGTWTQNGKDLTITVDFSIENINLSGNYTIEESNSSSLRIYTERQETYTYPDSGNQVTGTIKATLYFNKL